jgi:FkbM family methyltransferase
MKELIVLLWKFRRVRKKVSFVAWAKLYIAEKWATKKKIWSITLKTLPFPLFFRTRTVDIGLIRSILLDARGGEYPTFSTLNPKFIIDAGANIGIASVFFRTNYPDATIVAIEPDQQNCELFKLNTQKYANVHLIQAGLGPDKGKFLKIRDENVAPYSYQLEQAPYGIQEVTIPELCERFGFAKIDILKCDIEGGEKELFDRNAEWITLVDNMFIELHDHYALGASKKLFACVQGQYYLRFRGENVILTRDYLEFANS